MLEVFTTPLRPFAEDVENHGEKLREFCDPRFQDLYVERELVWEGDRTDIVIPHHVKRARFLEAFGRLRASGVALPHFYVVGGAEYGEGGLRVVAEKIRPVSFEDAGREIVREKAEKALLGITNYIDTTELNNDILWDTAAYRQFVFGTSRTSREPEFHMVDLGGYYCALNDSHKELMMKQMAEFGLEVGQAIRDHSLFATALNLLYTHSDAA